VKPGQFVTYKSGKIEALFIVNSNNSLCRVVDGVGRLCKSEVEVHLVVTAIRDSRFNDTPTITEISSLMQMRTFPHWVHLIVAATSGQAVAPPPNSPKAASGSAGSTGSGYPIGSLILGTGKVGNVWIVNKDNNKDISLLWDGKSNHFCPSELTVTDRIAHNPPVVSINKALDAINDKLPPTRQVHFHDIPQWAKNLMIAPHKTPTPPSNKPVPHLPNVVASYTGMVPKVNTSSENKIASIQDTCDHVFKTYVGMRESFEYCTHCDLKRGIQQ